MTDNHQRIFNKPQDQISPQPSRLLITKNYENRPSIIMPQPGINIQPSQIPKNLVVPRIQCHYHFDQVITMMCRSPQCNLPLCPNCIKIHAQEHYQQKTHAKYDTIDECFIECQTKLNLYCNQFAELIKHQQNFIGTTGDGLQEQLEKIKQAKSKALMIVDNFFETLDKDLRGALKKNHDYIASQSQNFMNYLNNRWQQLSTSKEKLSTPKGLKSLIKIFSQNIEQENDTYFKEATNFQKHLEQLVPHMIIDQAGVYKLSLDLANFVNLKTGIIQELYTRDQQQSQQISYDQQGNLRQQQKQTSPIRLIKINQDSARPVHQTENIHPYLLTPPRVMQFQPHDRNGPQFN